MSASGTPARPPTAIGAIIMAGGIFGAAALQRIPSAGALLTMPLAAILAIVCALWPAARRRLIWLVLLLAVGTLVLIPLTTSSGGWLADRVGPPSPWLTTHEQLGGTLIYIVAALVATVTLLAAVHIRQARGRTVKFALHSVANRS